MASGRRGEWSQPCAEASAQLLTVARHLVLVGPTASGKSALATALAHSRPGIELVSVDSMQVYRGMDIGTAKPSAAERAAVPHHLIDIASPAERFTVARFADEARAAIAGIEARGATAVCVGGTGLYVQALLGDLSPPGEFPDVRENLTARAADDLYAELVRRDPVAAARMEPGNRRRIVRALEVTIGSGRPFSSFGPGVGRWGAGARGRGGGRGWGRTRPASGSARSASGCPAPSWRRASPTGWRRW